MKRVFLLAAVLCVSSAYAAQPVGLLTAVKGTVQIQREGKPAPFTARPAELLLAGDRVITGNASSTAFIFCPGKRAGQIDAAAEVLFDAAAIKTVRGGISGGRAINGCQVPAALITASDTSQQAGLTHFRGSSLVLVSPSRTNVANRHPVFRWMPVDGAKSYEVKLLNRDERVIWSSTVTASRTEYPGNAEDLQWGSRYFWRVAARDGDDVVAEAGSWFKLLQSIEADGVNSEVAQLAATLKANPSDEGTRFLLAFLYEQNGMLDEAARVYADLQSVDWVKGHEAELLDRLGWPSVQP